MNRMTKVAGSCLLVLGTIVLWKHGREALGPALPRDMPRDSKFLWSGYDLDRNEPRGEWVACRVDPEKDTNLCRLTDSHGVVIFEGDFLPMRSGRPIRNGELRVVESELRPKDLWIMGTGKNGPVHVIPLANGDVLAPVADRTVLMARWRDDAEPLQRIYGR